MTPGSGIETQDTLVGGERSHHCANPAPPVIDHKFHHNIAQVL